MGARRKHGSYTWKDFIALPDDDRRELIDGELVEVEVPSFSHEVIVARLIVFLARWTRRHGGHILASGYKIRISDRRGVMPDVQLFREGNVPGPDDEQGLVSGTPDLVVEILSPTSLRYDRVVKLQYYAARRVPEYWIIDPRERTLMQLSYSGDGYRVPDERQNSDVFSPRTFPGLRIPLAELWAVGARTPKKRTRKRRR